MENLPPLVQVGKNGLTESSIAHIARVLRQRRAVRVKFLRSFPREQTSLKGAAEALAVTTGATRLSLLGFVLTLYKDRDAGGGTAKKASERQARGSSGRHLRRRR